MYTTDNLSEIVAQSWQICPGADPGFPVGGGANPQGGAPTYDFAKIFQKTVWSCENVGP